LIHDPELVERLARKEALALDMEVFRATRALAEISFRLSQQTPLPTKPIAVHRLRVTTRSTLRLNIGDLPSLGVSPNQYQTVDYVQTQKVGAAAAFLGHDSLLVPSARWECDNLILFLDNHDIENKLEVLASEEVDWQAWARANGILPVGAVRH